jgi:(R,R)-butanediol dehydrogenase/meso-butanediol dehydrogenase/diacetyl reductase
MRAARYYGKEDIRVEDIQEPETRPGTVKIAPAFTGICGSDLHLFFDGPMPPAPSEDTPHPLSGETLPVGFGHEFSGVVEEVGEGVDHVKPGDRVVVEPLMVDGTCPACKKGKYNLCVQMGFIGISGRGGGMSEHIVVEKQWVHKIGDMPLDQAAMIEPLAVALYAVHHAGITAENGRGATAVIGGAGPIGLLVASVLKAFGVRTVVSEVSSARRQLAAQVGVADRAVDPSAEDLSQIVNDLTESAGADVAFDAAGVPVVVDQLLNVLGAGGRLEIVALHGKPVEIDIMDKLTMHDRVVGACIGYAHVHQEAIELVQSGKVDLAPFITSKISVDDVVDQGLRKLHEDQGDEVKILVSMD